MMNGYSTTNSSKKRARSTSSGNSNNNNNRLLRLNVGGHPYDIIRTSLPLLETMMTDRWLDSCLLDSDGRIFLDRDGDAFGDVLRYLHGGADFLLELMNHSVRIGAAGVVGVGGEDGSSRLRNVHHHLHHYHHGASSFGDYSTTVSTNHHPSAMMMPSSSTTSNTTTPQHYQMDRLRRLRTEADYYGLHQLVHDIDSITIGSKIVFEEDCWGRVAGGFHSINNNNSGSLMNAPGVNNINNNNNNNDDDDGVNNHHGNNNQDNVGQQQQQINQDDNALLHHHQQQQQQQEQQQEQDVEEDDEEENDEEQAEEEDEEEEDEPDEIEDDDEEEEEESDEETYKNWSWSRQFGNPHILRPHPTHSSSMVVGQDGTYLLLLRFAAALPSPLARIKWEEEEEDRRVTRSVRARRRRRTRGGGGRVGEDGSSHGNDMGGGGGGGGSNDDNDDDDDDDDANHSKELEEDYFVTVNIEAPLQTVMDAVDESQTHFPILRAGLWDYRTEEEVLNEDPVYATVSAMEVVSLCAGDILSVSFMNDEVSREKSPLPDDCPPELVNSLTLIKVCGNTLARYERSKQSPGFVHHGNGSFVDVHPRQGGGGGGGGSSSRYSNGKNGMSPFHTPDRKSPYRRPLAFQNNASSYDQFDEDSSHDDDSNYYHQQEEFDRSLTRTAHWTKPRNDFDSTPFQPRLHSDASTLEFPHPGQYLLLGRVAVGCRRDATFQPVLSGGPLEGHRAQLSVRSAGGRLLHAVGAFVFEDKPRLSGSDLSILSENGMFNDVVYIPRSGTELSIRTTGDCRLHPEGTEVGPFCSAVSQCLSLLLIDDDIMEVDRYMLRTVRTDGPNPQRQIRWYHTRSATSPRGRGKGGTSLEPSLFDVDGHRLVWRGSCCSYTHTTTTSSSNNNSNTTSTVLIMGSIPPLHRGYVVALLKNNQPLAISITPESLDMKGRHCHYFQEIVELKDGDELTIADCAYGERWRDLFVESRRVELDTRMGHLSFVVLLQKSDEGEGGVVDVGAGADESNAMIMMMI
eukprot:scaffold376_cov137-Skeletonema_menzelii.AAC.10